MAFWRRVLAFFGFLPPARWEDGVRVTDPVELANYAALYAKTVAWVRVAAPQRPILAPEMHVTVRLYDRWPPNHPNLHGKVLAPNVIEGDIHGTLCLAKSLRHNTALIVHESKHANTGVSDHPKDLFPT
jgi:hypothetical protein